MPDPAVIQVYWDVYRTTLPDDQRPSAAPPEVWHFCDNEADANELAALVLAGIKTATASLHWVYAVEGERVPQPGDLSIIITWDGVPQCIIETTEVRILPYNEVDPQFAYDEGEGDRSLDYWRRVHWDFFSREAAAIGREPSVTMPVVCERFRVVYVGPNARSSV